MFYAAEQLARRPGRVLVEAPSYDRPLKILAREGAEIVALAMDDEGLDPDALEAELRSRSDPPSFLYTIPTFQNPSGRTLSAERRARLVEIVREHGLAVLEDDPYGLVRFEGDAPAEPARARGRGARHVHVVVLEDRRSGRAHRLLRASRMRDAAVIRGARRLDVHLAAVPPAGRRGRVRRTRPLRAEPRARVRRAAVAARRDARARSSAHAPAGSTWSQPEGGYFVWLDLDGADTTSSRRGGAGGVTFVAGSGLLPRWLDRRCDERARLAYSYETPERIAEGVAALAAPPRLS